MSKKERKLTDEEVMRIRRRYAKDKSCSVRSLAAEYDVSKSLIFKIIKFQVYRDVGRRV